ncbi:uncharacterized protein ColSpa_02665 [Colletotrichum spaethianum]|uniref:N-acetyltransferase domain-containing protein n=1 Tax=Colletotrichum spaethianum TaxID=700344 RepID=A0AA37P778_9PEZI|nr:uncharacterized protein ColSpa_02665 [Colletotrichum spaethianum]GKT42484.1 hypothetical protein ColSpa_02665 [Colletotrichum spaethianum]
MFSTYLPPGTDNAKAATTTTTTTTTTKLIGVIRTTRSSPRGLQIGYKLRSDCWGKGYATRAVCAFLDVYWSRPRWVPREEVFVPQTQGGGEVGLDMLKDGPSRRGENVVTRAAGLGGEDDEIEITHLIAQVDPENIGSMRVAEKSGGKLVAVDRGCVKVWRFPEMRDMATWRLDKPQVNFASA